MIQSGGFLGKLLGPLLKTGLPLIKKINRINGAGEGIVRAGERNKSDF